MPGHPMPCVLRCVLCRPWYIYQGRRGIIGTWQLVSKLRNGTSLLRSTSAPRGVLTQESIDRAFRNQQRISNLAYTYSDFQIVVIAGKNTGQLEVGQLDGPAGEKLAVTKLERTLIDSTVRPAYAGGVFHVL